MYRKLEKLTRFLVVFASILMLCCPIAVAMPEGENVGGRRIAIVFDNSDSMIIDAQSRIYSSRWAEATHALRTFLYMVEPTDEVKLFTVAGPTKENATSQEKQDAATVPEGIVNKTNVDTVLERLGISYQTKPYGMDAAYSWARSGSPNTEKWVVILSDGEFYPDGPGGESPSWDPVVNKANAGNQANIHTIFVGLDIDSEKLDALWRRHTLSVYNTDDSGGAGKRRSIEETILGISEEIYGMKELDNDRIRSSTEFTIYDQENGLLTWETEPGLSSYLNQIIIIAQRDMKPGEAPEEPSDPKVQVIGSDSRFSWCSEAKLDAALEEHDKYARENDGVVFNDPDDPRTFRGEIEKTFLGKCCYIRNYSGAEIGDKLEFQIPKGNYTYRIYYELRDSVTPKLRLEQSGVEVQPDSQEIYPVVAGSMRSDFWLSSEGVEIPKTLEAIKDTLKTVLIDGKESTGENSFVYNDIDPESNRHIVKASFNGAETEAVVEVEPDLRSYLFQISDGQQINLDHLESNQLIIETTIPPQWLENHLKESLLITPEEHVGSALTFDLTNVEFHEMPEGIRQILIPVDCRLNPSQDIHLEAVLSGTGSAANQAKARGALSITLDPTEIGFYSPEALANLSDWFEQQTMLYMVARTGDKDVTKETSLTDVTVTGLDELEGITFEYDENTKEIKYAGKFADTWRLFLSGANSGTVRIVGQAYRKGAPIEGSVDLIGAVAWSGSIRESIKNVFCFIVFIVALIAIFICTYTGKLLFQEGIDMILSYASKKIPLLDVYGQYPLIWRTDEETTWTVVTNHGLTWLPWKMCLRFRMVPGTAIFDSPQCVTLWGTKGGYAMRPGSEDELKKINIKFEPDNYTLEKQGQELKFQYSQDQSLYRLCYQRKRKRLSGACAICLLICLAAFPLYKLHVPFLLGAILVCILMIAVCLGISALYRWSE